MHSIELLLDPATDEALRHEWRALADAGLPSQARHTGESNAPHVTILAAPALSDEHDEELQAVAEALPVPVVFGGLVVFGRPPRGLVLERGIAVGEGILRFHRRVHDIVGDTAEVAPHGLLGEWTPHVTLATRLTPADLAHAVEVLADGSPVERGHLASARRWDSTAKTVTPLGGRAAV